MEGTLGQNIVSAGLHEKIGLELRLETDLSNVKRNANRRRNRGGEDKDSLAPVLTRKKPRHNHS